jgi:L-2-hydroxyglutarate oxidase
VIVATRESELPALEMLHDRGRQNGVACEIIDAARLHDLEPHAAGIRAIHVPEAGIVDFRQVCTRLAARIVEGGQSQIICSARVTGLGRSGQGVVVRSAAGDFEVGQVVNCAGLQSDRVAALSGQRSPARIVPFRGEYYELLPEVHGLVNNLIYPVPDPAFPFLGVHFTRMIGGSVECGPNAVLALGREAYGKFDVDSRDLFETLTYPGFVRLVAKHFRVGAGEVWRSVSKRAFVKALQRLVPEIRREHLVPAPAGIRAQAVTPDGELVDDFLIVENETALSVCNAPSPAATASLNIGRVVAERLLGRL